MPNGSISGAVTHNGAPADGTGGRYTVRLLDGDTAETVADTTTDENGTYVFSYLDDGDYRIEAQHTASGVAIRYPEQLPPATGAPVTVVGEATVVDIDLVLPDTGSISGAATEKSGPAVSDVTVVANSSTSGYVNSTRVADDGSYVIELPAGTYTITFASLAGWHQVLGCAHPRRGDGTDDRRLEQRASRASM